MSTLPGQELTPTYVKNCSDNQICIFVYVTIISDSVTSIITLKQLVLLLTCRQIPWLDHVHTA